MSKVLTINRRNYPITVLEMKVKDLDKTKCTDKFISHGLDGDLTIYVKCDKDGIIQYRGKKQEYRLFNPSKHELKSTEPHDNNNLINILKNWSKKFFSAKKIVSRKCKKSLYKSTYKGWAFNKNKGYIVVKENKEFYLIKDNRGNLFDFSKERKSPFYFIDDYFY